MNREQKLGLFGLAGITSIFLISMVFQNCAKVNYQTLDPSLQNSTTKSEVKLTARKVTVDPTFNQKKADMKVLFVVDDSYTMSQSQTQLAQAIDSLLNPLQGHNLEIKIVSTSGVPSNEVDFTLTNKYYSEDKIEIPQSQTSQLSSYLIEKNISVSSTKRHGTLKLYRESTISQFNNLKADVKAAILAVGVNGSDTEEGLCSSLRQLFDESSSRFFKPGDKAAIVILSDENDSSAFNRCSSKYKQRVSTKPIVYYNYGQQKAKLTFEYQTNKDGVTTWLPVSLGIPLAGDRSITAGATCSTADLNFATQKLTQDGWTIRNVSTCVYEIVPSTYYGADLGDDGSDPNKNLCNSTVTAARGVYANIYSMVNTIGYSAQAGSCTKQTTPSNTLSDVTEFESIIKSDSVAASAQDLKLGLMNKADNLFGSTGYIVAAITHLSSESCSLASGQSYGVKYQELSQLLGSEKSITQSLCNTDFSSTLAKVSQFIVTESNNSFSLPLQDGEEIKSVTVIRSGNRIALTSSQYEIAYSTVTLSNYSLVNGDTLEFDLGPK